MRYITLTALALLLPTASFAETVVLAPLLARSGAKTAQVMNVTSLISSELDFMPEFDDVVETGSPPSSSSCLASTSCLRGLANAGGGDALVTGTMSATSSTFTIDLVFYNNSDNRIVRRETFNIAADPESVADGMNDVVTAIVNGRTRGAAKDAESDVGDFEFDLDEGDDFEFEDDAFTDFDPEAELRKAKDAERARADKAREQEQRRRAEEARRIEEEHRRAEAEEAQRRAEAEARERAEDDARRRREEEAAAQARKEEEYARNTEAVFDPNAISFGKPSKDDITMEALNSAISFKAPVYNDVIIDEEEEDFYDDDEDLDLDGGSSRDSRNSRDSRSNNDSRSRDNVSSSRSSNERIARPDSNVTVPRVQLALRIGYAQYYVLGFVAGGLDITVPLGSSSIAISAGFEAFSTERQIPEEFWEEYGRVAEWNTMFPFHGGVMFKPLKMSGPIVPYIGAEVVGVQYYVDPDTGEASMAFGGRARGGVEVWLTNRDYKAVGVALRVNADIGFWQGNEWPLIEAGVNPSGVVPHGNAAIVISF